MRTPFPFRPPCLTVMALCGLLVALSMTGCSTGQPDEAPTRTTEGPLVVPAPTREDVLLIKRMQGATRDEVRDFIRDVLAEELPPGHATPGYIVNAGSVQAASEAIGGRYPEFYLKQGNPLLDAVAAHPVRYKELIRDTRAMRAHYEEHINASPR